MTCPNRACRRTDPHDAKGCVVAWEAEDPCSVEFWRGVESRMPDRAYFMPRRFKL